MAIRATISLLDVLSPACIHCLRHSLVLLRSSIASLCDSGGQHYHLPSSNFPWPAGQAVSGAEFLFILEMSVKASLLHVRGLR